VMKYVAIFEDVAGNRFEWDVIPDPQGDPLIDGNHRTPLPFYVPDNGAAFIGYELRDMPAGLRSCDAADLIYKMEQTLQRPARPSVAPAIKPVEPVRPLTYREQAYALQEMPIEVAPLGTETSSQAYRRAAAERADQVAKPFDQERQQQNVESWSNVSPGQRVLNEFAKAAKQEWAHKQRAEFARKNDGHVINNDGRSTKG